MCLQYICWCRHSHRQAHSFWLIQMDGWLLHLRQSSSQYVHACICEDAYGRCRHLPVNTLRRVTPMLMSACMHACMTCTHSCVEHDWPAWLCNWGFTVHPHLRACSYMANQYTCPSCHCGSVCECKRASPTAGIMPNSRWKLTQLGTSQGSRRCIVGFIWIVPTRQHVMRMCFEQATASFVGMRSGMFNAGSRVGKIVIGFSQLEA